MNGVLLLITILRVIFKFILELNAFFVMKKTKLIKFLTVFAVVAVVMLLAGGFMGRKFSNYRRECKYCGEYFVASGKYCAVCWSCESKHRKDRVLREEISGVLLCKE